MELLVHNELQRRIYKQRLLKDELFEMTECLEYEKEKDKVSIKLWKATRSIYLYLNRNKKHVFGFNTDMKKIWPAISGSKERLLSECHEKLNKCTGSYEYKKSLKLLIKTIGDYRDDYGMTIGLVLNRSFYWPIPYLIYEYL